MKKAFLVLSALLFVGAGCASTAPTTETPAVVPTTVKTAPAATATPSTTKTQAGASVKTSVQIVDPNEKSTK